MKKKGGFSIFLWGKWSKMSHIRRLGSIRLFIDFRGDPLEIDSTDNIKFKIIKSSFVLKRTLCLRVWFKKEGDLFTETVGNANNLDAKNTLWATAS